MLDAFLPGRRLRPGPDPAVIRVTVEPDTWTGPKPSHEHQGQPRRRPGRGTVERSRIFSAFPAQAAHLLKDGGEEVALRHLERSSSRLFTACVASTLAQVTPHR
ncbi:hypothetical protein AAFF_G00433190 [Aldrovandia affinis]|uniref:Uncharacterized protein n=1 Tax=Aldrovandia affinis TaxID=143900 RepID=A0AAD7S944_9TELE|nr:hypothetical protein AAFF_G00433190 [Aldrovandia affinis]